jgi:uncharacterized protein (TIGR02597 family)
MKTYLSYSFILAAAACSLATGQTAYTTPVGYVSQTCLSGSDTRVGLPLRQPTVVAAALTANPTIGATNAILTVTGANFGALAGTHYVKITTGPKTGSVYAITANTASTITIDRNGDTLSSVNGDQFSVSKFWTLSELFPPASSTGNPLTTGTAIVTSLNAIALQRRTEVLLPDSTTLGINLAPSASYYIIAANGTTILANQWRKQGFATDAGNVQLWPDDSFIIRNPVSVTSATKFTVSGEVDMGTVAIQLNTRIGGALNKQDNTIGLTRPVDITLDALNLANTSAFVSSSNAILVNRRDELLVFNNGVTGLNKAPSATYFFNSGLTPPQWRAQGGTVNAGAVVIPAGSAIVVRKFGTAGGNTSFWLNSATY